MKKLLLFSLVVVLGCGYSPTFKNNGRDFIKYAAQLNSKVDNSPVVVVTTLASETLVRWSKLETEWPDNKLQETKTQLSNAMKSISLVFDCYNLIQREIYEVRENSADFKLFTQYPLSSKLVMKKTGNVKYYDVGENLKISLDLFKKEIEKGIEGLKKVVE